MRQRQRQHEAVGRGGIRTRQGHAGQCDRHHQHADQRQVADEHPACRLQVGRVLALDHADMELARQADDGGERQQGLGEEAGRQRTAEEAVATVDHAVGQAAVTRQQPQRQRTDRHEGQQFHQRLQCDRQHHAAVVFGGVDAAGTEQDREHRQHQRDVQRGVAVPLGAKRLAAEHAHAHAHRLELQGEVRDRRDHRDHRHGGGQPACAAVAR